MVAAALGKVRGLFGGRREGAAVEEESRQPPRTFAVRPASELLAAEAVAGLVQEIEQLSDVPEQHFQHLYQGPLARFAEFIQLLPASETHHHASAGGLLRHTLETIQYALRLRRGYILPPDAEPERIQRVSALWSYGVFVAALLHDVGKVVSDQRILLYRADGSAAGVWNPWAGPIAAGLFYRPTYVRGRQYELHPRLAPVLMREIVPPVGLQWIAEDQQALAMLLAALNHDYQSAGAIGEILATAEGESIKRNLGGDAETPIAAAAIPLDQKLITAIRFLLDRPENRLNRPGGVAWVVGDDLWLVSQRIGQTVRAHLTEEGHSGIPSKNPRLFDVLQEHGWLIPNAEDKAIWKAHVELGSMDTELTLIRMPVARVWPDPESRPEDSGATITPLEAVDAEAAEEQVPTDSEDGAESVGGEEGSTNGGPDAEAEARTESSKDDQGVAAEAPGTDGPATGGVGAPLFGPAGASAGAQHEDADEHGTAEASVTPGETAAAEDAGASADHAAADNAGQPAGGDAPTFDPSGLAGEFFTWMRQQIRDGHVSPNTTSAYVHTAKDASGNLVALVVSPRAFQQFANTQGKDWKRVQKAVQKAKRHRRTANAENFHELVVAGKNKAATINAMMFADPQDVFGDAEIPAANPHISLPKPMG